MFDWEDLRYFTVFAQEKSLSAAARKLGVDHATVARRIAAIEAALQLKLVERRPRSYFLTADGERIAELGARMQAESFSVQRLAVAGQRGFAGDVKVSAPPVMTALLIAPHLARLHSLHPDLRVHLSADTRNVSLVRREAEIAIRLSRPVDDELVVRKLGVVSFSLYGAAGYANHPPQMRSFIAYDTSMEGSAQQEWLHLQRGAAPVVMQSNDLEIQAVAARSGLGIAALPDFVGRKSEQLVRFPHQGQPLEREVWIAVHADLRKSQKILAVMKFLTECLAEGLKP